MSEAVLSVRNISKSFGGIHAVRDVSFEVQKGEVLGLIGPNGSGKSTLFNCVLGQLTPDAGEVTINGRRVGAMRASHLNKLGVGRTFQQLSVFPQMSVLDNIILAGQEHHGNMASRLFGPSDAGLTGAADQMISYFVAFFTLQTVNWGMAAALACLLMAMTGLMVIAARAFVPGFKAVGGKA